MVRYSTTTHKIIATVSFLILSSVQFFLLYNTYELKDDHFYLAEQGILNNAYTKAVANDKIMPGGQRIMDCYLNGDMALMEQTWNRDHKAFDILVQKICDSAFIDLKKANNMDSLLGRWVAENHLQRDLEYALLVERVDIAFEPNKYINLYDKSKKYSLIDPVIQSKDGIRIGGALKEIACQEFGQFLRCRKPCGSFIPRGIQLSCRYPQPEGDHFMADAAYLPAVTVFRVVGRTAVLHYLPQLVAPEKAVGDEIRLHQ
jgi:hypothetical protein